MSNKYQLVFEFPLPANIANSRMHWAVKLKAKKAYWATLDALVMARKNPKPPQDAWQEASAGVVMRTFREMDADNATARLKWCLDWLETRGYVQNDRDVAVQVETEVAPLKLCGITLALVAA